MQKPFFSADDMDQLSINDDWKKERAKWVKVDLDTHFQVITGYDGEVNIMVSIVGGQDGSSNVVAVRTSPDDPQKVIQFTGTWKGDPGASGYWLNMLNERILEWVRDPLA